MSSCAGLLGFVTQDLRIQPWKLWLRWCHGWSLHHSRTALNGKMCSMALQHGGMGVSRKLRYTSGDFPTAIASLEMPKDQLRITPRSTKRSWAPMTIQRKGRLIDGWPISPWNFSSFSAQIVSCLLVSISYQSLPIESSVSWLAKSFDVFFCFEWDLWYKLWF